MSEFGKGYAYCLGLFIAHEALIRDFKQKGIDPSSWFNGAADHLFDLVIPASFPDEKKKEAIAFKEKCIFFRLFREGTLCTWEDAIESVSTAKRLLLEWDIANGIDAEKGEWQ